MMHALTETKIDSELVQKLIAEETSGQSTGGKAPILQGHRNRIERRLLGHVRNSIQVTNQDLLPVVSLSSNDLVGTIFDSGRMLALEDFQRAYPGFTRQMLTPSRV